MGREPTQATPEACSDERRLIWQTGVVYCEMQAIENEARSVAYLALRKLLYPGEEEEAAEGGGGGGEEDGGGEGGGARN
eukprot:655544-Hanusia_phi.AAC.2